MRKKIVRTVIGILLMGAGFGLGAPSVWACEKDNYYDPSHQICQPSPPAYTPPGYGWPPTNGGSNYGPSYDRSH
jgi:hypothetical protein